MKPWIVPSEDEPKEYRVLRHGLQRDSSGKLLPAGLPGMVKLPNYRWIRRGLILLAFCAALALPAVVMMCRPGPLAPDELHAIEQELGFKFPKSTSAVHTFFRRFHQGMPNVLVKAVFDQTEVARFVPELWLKDEAKLEEWQWGKLSLGEPLPSWWDVLPLRATDLVYDLSWAGRWVVLRNEERRTTAYIVDRERPVRESVSRILTRYPFEEEPPVLGPPIVTGVREWP